MNATTPKTDAFVAALRRRGVEVLTHEQWGSARRDLYRQRLTTHPHGLLPANPVDTFWNHITVTADDGPTTGDFAADLREVERIGYQRFGSGVSYNIIVDPNAERPRVAIGQFLEAKGTHTVNDKGTPGYSYNQNKVALAVAWLGVPGDKLNPHAVEALVQVNAALVEVKAMTDHYDNVPHSLVAAKDCPTDELRDRLPEIKRRALAAVNPPAPTPPAPVELTDVAVTIGTFNNCGYPAQEQELVNAGDYAFHGMRPDLGGEQERWVPGQLGGFRKIFNNAFFTRFAPLFPSGTIVFHRKTIFTRLAKFRFKATDRVKGVCGGRKFTGEVLAFRSVPGATLTHLSLHLPPSGWGDRFPDGDSRQMAARREVYDGLARVKAFAERQIRAGRDFVVIETDANAKRDVLVQALGTRIAGKPVHIFTSQHGHRIDHIVVIGEVARVIRKWNAAAPSDHAPYCVRLALRVPVR